MVLQNMPTAPWLSMHAHFLSVQISHVHFGQRLLVMPHISKTTLQLALSSTTPPMRWFMGASPTSLTFTVLDAKFSSDSRTQESLMSKPKRLSSLAMTYKAKDTGSIGQKLTEYLLSETFILLQKRLVKLQVILLKLQTLLSSRGRLR